MMNSKQRVMTALNIEQPDRVPIVERIVEPIMLKLVELLGLEIKETDEHLKEPELACTLAEELGLDWLVSYPSTREVFIDKVHFRDKYGCVFMTSKHGDPFIVEGPIKELADLEGYDMVAMVAEDDFDGQRHIKNRFGEDKAIAVNLTDPFKISWILRGGMQNLLMDYMLDPELVHSLARVATDYELAVIEIASQIGADMVIVAGDLASELNTLMSPRHYREYIKPYQKELVDFAHEKGMKAIKHSDGNMWPILDDHIEIGFDGYHPIQPQCMDIGEVKESIGKRICLIGNIDCRNLLCFGTEEEVEEKVRQTIDIAAPGGGYMISSSNSIHPGVKPENYLAMVRAAREHGRYST